MLNRCSNAQGNRLPEIPQLIPTGQSSIRRSGWQSPHCLPQEYFTWLSGTAVRPSARSQGPTLGCNVPAMKQQSARSEFAGEWPAQ
jgi:hypothetical protein